MKTFNSFAEEMEHNLVQTIKEETSNDQLERLKKEMEKLQAKIAKLEAAKKAKSKTEPLSVEAGLEKFRKQFPNIYK